MTVDDGEHADRIAPLDEEVLSFDPHEPALEGPARVPVADRVPEEMPERPVPAPEVVVEGLSSHAKAVALETHRGGVDPARDTLERDFVRAADELQDVGGAHEREIVVVNDQLHGSRSAS